MIKIGNLVTLSDNSKYIVLSILELNNITYAYLLNESNYSNIMICACNNDLLTTITDEELIKKLVVEFYNDLSSNIL